MYYSQPLTIDFPEINYNRSWTIDIYKMQHEINKLCADMLINQELMAKPKLLVTCNHSWKYYQGFTENYEYCVLCDQKK